MDGVDNLDLLLIPGSSTLVNVQSVFVVCDVHLNCSCVLLWFRVPQVRIALQMEDGSRLQGSFSCGQSLWELLAHFPQIRCVYEFMC